MKRPPTFAKTIRVGGRFMRASNATSRIADRSVDSFDANMAENGARAKGRVAGAGLSGQPRRICSRRVGSWIS